MPGEHPGGLAGGAHGDVFAGFGDKHVDAEDGGGDAADGFALGTAADEEDAVGFLFCGILEGDHGVAHGAEYSFDSGAGDVLAGGVGVKTPEDAGGIGEAGAVVDACGGGDAGGADGDAHVAGLQVEAEGGGHVVAGAGADKRAGMGLTNGLVGGGQFGQARVVAEVQACDHDELIISFLCNLRGGVGNTVGGPIARVSRVIRDR